MTNTLKDFHFAGLRIIVGFFLFVALACSLAASSTHIQRARFIGDFNNVFSLIQDRDRFVWIASGHQLIRYDGYAFRHFSFLEKNRVSPDAQIQEMIQDRAGNIWLATRGDGLLLFDIQRQEWTRHNKLEAQGGRIMSRNLSSLFLDSQGTLWIGSVDDGLYCFEIGGHKCLHIPLPQIRSGQALSHVVDICQDWHGNILVATWGGGVFSVGSENGRLERFLVKRECRDVPMNEYVTCLLAEEDTLWLGTRLNGVWGIDLKTRERTQYLGDFSRDADWTWNFVTFINRNRDGTLWVGTGGGGLHLLDELAQRLQPVPVLVEDNRFINTKNLTAIMEDSSGGKWLVSSPGALIRCHPRLGAFQNYFYEFSGCEHLRVPIYAIMEDREGDLWLGSDGEGLIRFNRQEGLKEQYKIDSDRPSSIGSNYINTLFQDEDGQIYIGCHLGGLNRLDPKSGVFESWKHVEDNPQSLSGDVLTAFLKDSRGHYWVGTWQQGLNRFSPQSGTFQHYQHNPNLSESLPGESVTVLFEDSAGCIWLGLNNGLCRMEIRADGVGFIKIQMVEQRVFDASVRVIHEGKNGDLWIGTEDRGVFRIRSGESVLVEVLGESDLPNLTVSGILEDNQSMLWISTFNGLCRYNGKTGRIDYFNTLDGISNNRFSHGFLQCRDGEFLLGNQNGLVGFGNNGLEWNEKGQPVLISEVNQLSRPRVKSAFGVITDRMTFSYNDTFSVSFSTLSYSNPLKIRYRYCLDGREKDEWVDLGNLNQVVLSHLKPGRHRLLVEAADSSNRWSPESAVLKLYVTPPFWQSWWFVTLLSGLSVAGGIWAYRYHIRNITRRIESEVQFNAYCDKKKLTNREREVLQLVLAGKTNQEIEDALFLSMGTIKVYVHNLYRKLGAKNRMALINSFNRLKKDTK